jgi:hypothetical protein
MIKITKQKTTEYRQEEADRFWERYKNLTADDAGVIQKTGVKQSTLSTWKTKRRFPGASTQ